MEDYMMQGTMMDGTMMLYMVAAMCGLSSAENQRGD